MLPYAIGLDIGITSVGWATVALDENDRPYGIIGMGARIFDAAEQPKTGASLAAPRREARSMRRRLRRHRHRNERIRNLLVDAGVVTTAELEHLFEGKLKDIYELRVRALDELVNDKELARILIHISQRRGFRSNRKGVSTQEDGQLLTAVSANAELMASKGYRTVAELYLKDEIYREHKRNKGGRYISTVSRDMVVDEVRQIFASQRSLGNQTATEKLESSFLEILLSQRSFDEGPGEGSPYAGSQIERMIGHCTFEPDEERAAKATYSFEYFSLLEAINHIRIISPSESVPLTQEQRKKIIDLVHHSAEPNYSRIRKELQLPDTQRFNTVSYQKAEPEEAEKKTKLAYLKAYHQMRLAFDRVSKGHFADLSIAQRNAIGTVLSKYKTSAKIRPALAEAGLSEQDIDIAETLSFSKFGHISVMACDKLIPFLEQGMNYNDACSAAGYDFRAHGGDEKTRLLPPLDENAKTALTSPVVLRAVSQTIKVVNAIIRERGCSPTFVNIELAREMSKDFQERNKIKKEQDENRRKNEQIMQRIREEYNKQSPTGQDLVKLKLYEEQGGVCAYSLRQMSIEHLFDTDYAEVDHIVPYSASFDDSYSNKVLVLSGENRNKGNRVPLEYLSGKRRENFIVWVNSSVRDFRKRRNLLREHITEEDRNGFIERNLQDTKTASRFLLNYIQDYLVFAPFQTKRTKHVTAVNGSVTAYLRKRWGITKVRADGDLHHAVDALVVACTTDGLIHAVSSYMRYKENRYLTEVGGNIAVDPETGEVITVFPFPWARFREELVARLSSNPAQAMQHGGFPLYLSGEIRVKPLFVSRVPRRKVTGAAHMETAKSGKELADGVLIVRQPLTKLKLAKDGSIANYYNPASDRLLYEALLKQLEQYGGDAKKAFAEPFHKPKRDGTPGPVVSGVKLIEPTTLNVPVLGGNAVADNDSMVRIDVFFVEGDGYYFVPIYVADTLKPALPSKACVAHKPYAEWKEMKDENFIFSLYPNDLIRITHKKVLALTLKQADSELEKTRVCKSELLYYVSAGISAGSISVINHDNSYKIDSLGVKNLEKLEKYTVDVLGNCFPVKKEHRQGFHRK